MLKQNKPRQLGTWIPIKISQMDCLSGREQSLYAHIYSFGGRGCWQTNAQLAKRFGRKLSSIKRYLSSLNKAGLIHTQAKGTKYRKLWAKTHPQVKRMLLAQIRTTTNKQEEDNLLAQIRASTGPNPDPLLAQIRATTNKYTNKNTIKHGGPPPLLAKEQAAGPPKTKEQGLAQNKAKTILVDFQQNVGKLKKEPMSEKEFNERRQRQLKALGK